MIRLLAGCVLLFPLHPAAGEPLPRIASADWPKVRQRCGQLLEVLKRHPGALPAAVEKEVRNALRDESEEGMQRLQEVLDPLCLVGVHINPESRVKAARGMATAELKLGEPRIVLLRIHNEGGITAPLNVAGEEIRTRKEADSNRWLEVQVINDPPLRTLGGARLEYVAVRLVPHEAGKREATLKFDAGQGTQDLGFRAEVPILFRVRER